MTPSAALLWTLSRDLGLDGFRPAPATLTADYAAGCKAGLPLACEVSNGAVPRDARAQLDEVTLRGRAREWCAQQDDLSCLVEAMLLVRDPFTGYGTDTPPEDQRTARIAFANACDRGLARGCTELGMAYLRETWSYPSEAWARASFARACEAGEPEGCRQLGALRGAKDAAGRKEAWERAAALGNVEARADLARVADDPVAAAEACALGSSAACRAVGEPGKACDAGDPDACLTQLLQRAAAAGTPPAELSDTLASLCPTLDRACREAEFLRDGSPVIASEPGLYASPGLVERYLVDVKEQLRTCHVRALRVNPDAHGVLDVWIRIGAKGDVLGVHTPNAFDQGIADCADRVIRATRLKPPLLGTLLSHVRLPFDATTRVVVEERDNDPTGGSLALMRDEMQARGEAFDACVIQHDDPRYVREGAFEATIDRSGAISGLTWTSADFEPETKACLEAVVSAPFRSAPLVPKRFSTTLRFLEEYQVPTWKILLEPLPPPVPDRFRLLALVPAEASIEGRTVAAPGDAAARVEQVHAAAAELISGFTRGGLQLETKVRTIPARIEGPTLDVEDDDLTRLRFEAFDVPDAIWGTLPVGEYDGIVLWVPTPAGAVVDVGTTTHATLRGATFSALPLPSDRERAPRVETLLHGVWSQYAARAEGQLGVDLPSADQPLESEGQTFDPEFWTLDPYRPPTVSGMRVGDQTGDATPFYSYLFRKLLHPAMRADLARLDRADVPAPDDLALLAAPLREGGARNVEVITDGRRAMNPPEGESSFADASWLAIDRPDDDLGWWGVSWASPVEVRSVRLRLGESADGPATVRRIAVEGRAGGAWTAIATVEPATADVVVTLPAARAFDAVRARVLARVPDVKPALHELEVYPRADGP